MRNINDDKNGSNGRSSSSSTIPGSGAGADEEGAAAAAADDQPPIRKRCHTQHKRLLIFLLAFSCFITTSSAAFLQEPSPAVLEATRTAPYQSLGNSQGGVIEGLFRRQNPPPVAYTCACPLPKRKGHGAGWYVEVLLIPVLVILAGIFAGLTLGYMSLDMNQLQVLAKTGTPSQKRQAERIIPLRRNGHLLLVSLLLCNMAASETLPVVSEPVLGGGIQSVIVSTVLVIIFSEIVPQSVCSRFGLQIGSFMVWPARIVIGVTFIISWPVSKLLEYLLGAHSGVVYRRAELKELITMHGDTAEHGGDLNKDTITIVGATLDLQEKVVRDAMTHSDKVFMLDIDAKLDYATLTKILKSGHSRIPVYEEVEASAGVDGEKNGTHRKKIIGGLLTKQLILLDPEDAVPLRDLPLNPFPTVPENMPLLHILNTFQEGRSHMAMVARAYVSPPRKRSNSNETINNSESGDQPNFFRRNKTRTRSLSPSPTAPASGAEISESAPSSSPEKEKKRFFRSLLKRDHAEKAADEEQATSTAVSSTSTHERRPSDPNVKAEEIEMTTIPDPDDIVGLITLEDVLEELIGEEIEDEFDSEPLTGRSAAEPYIPAEAKYHIANTSGARRGFGYSTSAAKSSGAGTGAVAGLLGISSKHFEEKSAFKGDGTAVTGSNMPKEGVLTAFKRNTLGMSRSASAPGRRRTTSDENNPSSEGKSQEPQTSVMSQENLEPTTVALSTDSSAKPGYSGLKADEGLSMTTNPTILDQGDAHTNGAVTKHGPALDLISERNYDSDEGDRQNSPGPKSGPQRRRSLDDRQQQATSIRNQDTDHPRRGRQLPLAPLLSDALLLERGRKQLRAKGQDPDSVKLRIATRSSTPLPPAGSSSSGNSIPRMESTSTAPGGHYLIVSPPGKQAVYIGGGAPSTTAGGHVPLQGPGAGIRKQSFKTPMTQATSIPVRAATKSSRPDTPKSDEIIEQPKSKTQIDVNEEGS